MKKNIKFKYNWTLKRNNTLKIVLELFTFLLSFVKWHFVYLSSLQSKIGIRNWFNENHEENFCKVALFEMTVIKSMYVKF